MGPEETRKGEVPRGTDTERAESERERERQRQGAPPEEEDPREDEGWSQPESSAQKGPPGFEEPS